MKKLLLYSIIIYATTVACSNRPKGVMEKCVITEIVERSRYDGLTPDKDYMITTDCGYTLFTSGRFYSVGDTIDVEVIDMRKGEEELKAKPGI